MKITVCSELKYNEGMTQDALEMGIITDDQYIGQCVVCGKNAILEFDDVPQLCPYECLLDIEIGGDK